MIKCQCGMTIVKIGGGRIACRRCGSVVDVPADSYAITTCVHRGDIVGVAKCECAGLPKVFACKIHKLAMQRKLKPGRVRVEIGGEKSIVEMVYCNACDDLTPNDGRTYRKSIQIVTSFSPTRTERQLACLASWKRLGVPIVAVQPSSEIDAMAATYEGVRWVSCDGQRPTIAELANMANEEPILLINSDIAIESTVPEFRRDWLAIEGKTLRVGCRWETPASGDAYLQRWGIDAFLITQEMLADFRDIGFKIGQPVWDYWIVIHYAAAGYAIRAKIDRGLSHESHLPVWTKADGRKGTAAIEAEYGIDRDGQNRRIGELTGRR